MTKSNRGRIVALCALALIAGAIAPPAARAQIAYESVGGVEVQGAYLLYAVTDSDPSDGGRVTVGSVDAFEPEGGLAIFEPASSAREVFSYHGIAERTSELTGVVRTAPSEHPSGSFVQAIENASPSPDPSESPSSKPRPRDRPSESPPEPSPEADRLGDTNDAQGGDAEQPPEGGFGNAEELAPPRRSFATDALVSAAAQLYALGWSEKSARTVYSPFPVAGPATFTDTWGALRYGPAPGQIRGHEGQDIFCDFGVPILAVTSGRIQFDTNGLGGRIARLHMADGSYFYYAHLSRWNRAAFANGNHVEPGDVIGFCGHSGDAKTTPNHLHFGWYSKKGKAYNPMDLLVGWLRLARQRAGAVVHKVERRVVRRMELQMLGRMFGDSWAPDLTTVSPSPGAGSVATPAPSDTATCDPGVIAPGADASEAPCMKPNGGLVPTEVGE